MQSSLKMILMTLVLAAGTFAVSGTAGASPVSADMAVKVILGEAADQGFEGMVAVAAVKQGGFSSTGS